MGQLDRRKRRFRLGIAIGVTAATVALCLTVLVLRRANVSDSGDAPPARTYKKTPADRAVREKLNSRIARLDLDGVELRQAIRRLRETSGSKIRVNWPALAKEGVQPETTVKAHLKNVTLSKAIETVLDDVSCIGRQRVDETGLGHVIEDGAITISSKFDLVRHTVVRDYDIGDITALALGFERRQAVTMGDDAGQADDIPCRSEIVARITCIITEIIDYRSWNDPGGDVSEKDGKLVVTQGTANHESIARLLENIRTRLKNRSSDPCPDHPSESDIAVRKQLEAKIAKVDFDDIELRKAIDFIRDRSGANIHVKRHALAREWIKPATTISVQMAKVTLGRALQAVCNEISDGGEPGIGQTGMAYIVRDGVITISTKCDLAKNIPVRIYDIRDLMTQVALSGDRQPHYDTVVHVIVGLLRRIIYPSCWCHRHEGSSIREIGGLLIATLTIENHELLARLLRELQSSFRNRGRGIRLRAMSAPDHLAHKQLDVELETFCFEDMELRQVIQFFRDVSGANINVDWRALAAEGVKPDTGLRVYFPSRITVGRALEIILDSLPANEPGMGYVIRDGVVRISTQYGLGRHSVFRIYDVDDVIARIREYEGPRTGRNEAIAGITTLIRSSIDLSSWRSAGGIAGEICDIGGLLVVAQTINNHEAIAGLLGDLRRHFKTPNLDARSYIETQADRVVRKQFAAKIPKLDFDDVEFRQAMETLLEISEIDLYVNWHSFAQNEAKESRKVSVHLKNVTLREAISAVFDSANKGGGPPTNYIVEGGAMWIAPEAKLRRLSVIRIYDARIIIARKMKSGNAGGKRRDKAIEGITALIRKTIDPDTWLDEGGELGAIYEIGGLLVVVQTRDNHESLAELISKLRAEK